MTKVQTYTPKKLQGLLDMLDNGILKSGGHKKDGADFCAMEFVAKVAGEPWTDSPKCVHPALAAYCRSLNDGLWPDDKTRTKIMLPLLAEVFGTAGLKINVSNIAVATVREILPPMLRMVAAMDGMPKKHAAELRKHAKICSAVTDSDASYAASYAANASYAASYASNASYAASKASYAASYAASNAANASYAASYAASDAASYAASDASYAASKASYAASYAASDASYAASKLLAPYKTSIAIVIAEIKRARKAL